AGGFVERVEVLVRGAHVHDPVDDGGGGVDLVPSGETPCDVEQRYPEDPDVRLVRVVAGVRQVEVGLGPIPDGPHRDPGRRRGRRDRSAQSQEEAYRRKTGEQRSMWPHNDSGQHYTTAMPLYGGTTEI